jgi:hypothetical protein
MSLSDLEKLEVKEIFQETAKIVTADLTKRGVIKRWVTRKEYARYHGFSTQYIHYRTKFLRKKGAVRGEYKAMRYDKFCDPNTGECAIPEDMHPDEECRQSNQ